MCCCFLCGSRDLENQFQHNAICRLIPAYVEEEAWINLAGEFEIGMPVEVKVHKVRSLCCREGTVTRMHFFSFNPASQRVTQQRFMNRCPVMQIFSGPRCRFPIQLELLQPAELCSKM